MLNKKLQSLLEELTSKGDIAKTDNEATKENQPELYKVQLGNKEIYTKDSHKEVEEIKEVIVESYSEEELAELFENLGLDTDKYTFNYLAEQLGFEVLDEEELTSKGDIAKTDNEATDEGDAETAEPDTDNEDVYPTDEHDENEEVEEVVVEGEVYDEDELLQLFEELELDTEKYTFNYLAEQLGFELVEASEINEEDIISENKVSIIEALDIYNDITSVSLDQLSEALSAMSYEEIVVIEGIINESENFISLNEGLFRGNAAGDLKKAHKANNRTLSQAGKALVSDAKATAKAKYKESKKALKGKMKQATAESDYNKVAKLASQKVQNKKQYKLNKKQNVNKIKTDVGAKRAKAQADYSTAKKQNWQQTSGVGRAATGIKKAFNKVKNKVSTPSTKPANVEAAKKVVYGNQSNNSSSKGSSVTPKKTVKTT
jgi:hypothetical protein